MCAGSGASALFILLSGSCECVLPRPGDVLGPGAPKVPRRRSSEKLEVPPDAEGAESVAARFARACREVESARAARREKNLKKQRNRQRNKLGSAERHIWNAMNDMALVDGNGYR